LKEKPAKAIKYTTWLFGTAHSRYIMGNRMIDTCGVTNLHGWPGLMGGLATIFVIQGISPGMQLAGIGIMILVSLVPGYIVVLIILTLGRVKRHYDDSVEIIDLNQG
jgi:hypothetical protein